MTKTHLQHNRRHSYFLLWDFRSGYCLVCLLAPPVPGAAGVSSSWEMGLGEFKELLFCWSVLSQSLLITLSIIITHKTYSRGKNGNYRHIHIIVQIFSLQNTFLEFNFQPCPPYFSQFLIAIPWLDTMARACIFQINPLVLNSVITYGIHLFVSSKHYHGQIVCFLFGAQMVIVGPIQIPLNFSYLKNPSR